MILIILLIVLILFLIFYVSKSSQIIYPIATTKDFVIVGAGISGLFLGVRLSQFYPNANIKILEKQSRIGGRLYSVSSDTDIAYELGGMRAMENIHPLILTLASQLNEPTIQIPYVPPNNYNVVKHHHVRIYQMPYKAKYYYRLRPDEQNKSADELVSMAINNTIKSITNIYEVPEITNTSFIEILKTQLSEEAIKYYQDTTGYNFFTLDLNGAIGIDENISVNPNNIQVFFKNGYDSLITKLANIFTNNGQSQNHTILCQNQLENFTLDDNITLTIKSDNNKYEYQTENLILTLLPNDLLKIPSLNIKSILMDNFLSWQSFKVFLEFEYDFWSSIYLTTGRSTTDSFIRQLWVWPTPNTLLVYNDMNDAEYWFKFLPEQKEARWCDGRDYPEFVKEMRIQLEKFTGIEQSKIKIVRFIYKIWKHGAYFYKPCDFHFIQDKVRNPYGKDISINIVNSDYSQFPGWTHGSLIEAEQYLSIKFGIPSINVVPIK